MDHQITLTKSQKQKDYSSNSFTTNI